MVYAYEIVEVRPDLEDDKIKAGTVVITKDYHGKLATMSYFNSKERKIERLLKMKYLCKTDTEIWTEEGKREFEEKLENLRNKRNNGE